MLVESHELKIGIALLPDGGVALLQFGRPIPWTSGDAEEAMMVRSFFFPHHMVQHFKDRGADHYGGQVYGTIPLPLFPDTDNEFVVHIVHCILGLLG